MNKFIVWNNKTNQLDSVWEPYAFTNNDDTECYESTGKIDIHGNEICYDFHIVKFKLDCLNSVEEKVGVFHFDDRLLRAYVAVCYGYLIYSSNASDIDKLEIIGNVKENPELIGEGKI